MSHNGFHILVARNTEVRYNKWEFYINGKIRGVAHNRGSALSRAIELIDKARR